MSGLVPDFGVHAAFIWASYGVGAVVIGRMILASWLRHRAVRRQLARLERDVPP